MKYLTICILWLTLFSCQKKQETKSIVTEKKATIAPEDEIRKWKKELILNREIGPPCTGDPVQWQEENPEQYYGLPNEINFKSFDINQDTRMDYIFYFNPGDPCGGGNTYQSDFIKLVYSDKEDYLYNRDLTLTIHNKLSNFFSNRGLELYGNPIIIIETFDKNIAGVFKAWHNDDAHCCPTYTGSFSYNLNQNSLEVNYSENLK